MNYQRTRVALPEEEISTGIEKVLRNYSIESILGKLSQVDAGRNNFNLSLKSPTDLEVSHRRNFFDSVYKSFFELYQRSVNAQTVRDDRIERQKHQSISSSSVEKIRTLGLKQAQNIFNSRPERGNFILDLSLDKQILNFILTTSQLRQTNYPQTETSSLAIYSFNITNRNRVQDNEITQTNLSSGLKSPNMVSSSIFQFSSSIPKSTSINSASPEKSLTSQLQPKPLSTPSPEKMSSDKDPELERIKKAIGMLDKLNSEKASKPEKIKEGIMEFATPGFIAETILDFKDVIDVLNEKQRLDKTLPGGQYSSARHQAGAAFAAREIDPNDARTAGILNEFIGSFEISDLIDNEIGIGNAGFPDYAYEILKYVKQRPELYARYADEVKDNPFKHIGIELSREYPERYNLGIRNNSKPEDRFNLGVSKSYDNSERDTNTPNSPSAKNYNLGVRLPEIPSTDTSQYSPELLRGNNQPNQSTPSKPENQKSGSSGSKGDGGADKKGGGNNSDLGSDWVGPHPSDNIA